jgi:hypothetical protein
MPPLRRVVVRAGLCLLTLTACTLFSSLSGNGSQNAASGGGGGGGGAAVDPNAAADKQLAADLDAKGREIDTQGVTSERALAYADLVLRAHQSGALQRGTIYGPTVVNAGIDHAKAAREADPDQAAILLVAEGQLELIRDRKPRALEAYVEAIGLDPSPPIFWALVGLPEIEGRNAAVAAACPQVRPAVTDAELHDFVGVCLDASGGDRKALAWKTAKKEIKAYDVEQQRREEEQRRREEEERKRREEEERLAAEAAQKSQRYASAAVFAAGRCEFGDCVGNGWTTRADDGEIRTRCSFGKCLENGWETTFPDGSRATTRCSFGKCLENGWETTFPDGSRATTRCSFGKCAENGWETNLPDGSRSTTRCEFAKCFENGWETRLPDGGSVRCRCSFSKCLENGAECG